VTATSTSPAPRPDAGLGEQPNSGDDLTLADRVLSPGIMDGIPGDGSSYGMPELIMQLGMIDRSDEVMINR
jgi:hypothetical protein